MVRILSNPSFIPRYKRPPEKRDKRAGKESVFNRLGKKGEATRVWGGEAGRLSYVGGAHGEGEVELEKK